jgi:hypothetical protein
MLAGNLWVYSGGGPGGGGADNKKVVVVVMRKRCYAQTAGGCKQSPGGRGVMEGGCQCCVGLASG